jgi:type II secretory pathway component PulF
MMNLQKTIDTLSFSPTVRRRFYGKLAEMTRHNIGVLDGVIHIRNRMKQRGQIAAHVLDRAVEILNTGKGLHVALSDAIPGEEAMLIRGGIQSGKLPAALDLAVAVIEARQKIVNGIREALGYPILLSGMFLILLFVVSNRVVPQLALISDPTTWQSGAYTLYVVADFVNSIPGVICLTLPVLLLVLAVSTLPNWTGRMRTKLDRIPPWSFYRLVNGSVWLFTLSTLLQANVQITHALDAMRAMPGTSPWLKERIDGVKSGLLLGKGFGVALDRAGFDFPDRELIDDLLVYSTLPGFEKRLHIIAEEWLQSGLERATTQAKIINTICICSIIATMCGLALAVTSLQQSLLGQGMGF